MLAYALTIVDHFFERFSINHHVLLLDPRFNARHGQDMPIVYRMGTYQLGEEMQWGLIPFWNKHRMRGDRIATAKAETVMQIPIFKTALQTHRCLIPATGFYVWAKAHGRTQPYYVHLTHEPVMSFAGLYDAYHGKDGKEHKQFSVLTTHANRLLQPISERMPVVLQRKDENRWLAENLSSTALMDLLKPYPDAQMAMYPVGRFVNSPYNDSGECLRPVVEATGC